MAKLPLENSQAHDGLTSLPVREYEILNGHDPDESFLE